jgi:hypothetical protein
MVHLGYEAQMAACFVRLNIVVILTQNRCTVCPVCTIGSEIILDALYELLHDVGHMESHFGPFGCKIGARFVPNVPEAQK